MIEVTLKFKTVEEMVQYFAPPVQIRVEAPILDDHGHYGAPAPQPAPKRQRKKPEPAQAVSPSEVKPPELADVQAAIEAVFEAKGLVTARDLLSRYGVKKAGELRPEQYAKFIEEAKRVAAGEDPAAAR